jgi:hypothetical protein
MFSTIFFEAPVRAFAFSPDGNGVDFGCGAAAGFAAGAAAQVSSRQRGFRR